MTNWPSLDRLEVVLLAIQEELWIRTGLNFYAFKWDWKEEFYIIHLVFRDKKIRNICVNPFSLAYSIKELKETPMSSLIDDFFKFIHVFR